MSTVSPPAVQNYMAAPFMSLYVNSTGQCVKTISTQVEISYTELNTTTSNIGSIAYRVLHCLNPLFFGCCNSCVVRQVQLIKTFELNSQNLLSDLEEQIDRVRKEHPSNFSYTILNQRENLSPAPIITPAVEQRAANIERILANNNILAQSAHIQKILLAREIALAEHQNNPNSIVCIPSKSKFFNDINPAQKEENAATHTADPIHVGKSLASVRVFPDRSSSLTIPLLNRRAGGMKILNLDIRIGPEAPDASISLTRRIKIKRERRAVLSDRSHEIMLRVSTFTHPGILVPQTLYLHPKKGLEYLVENCKTDFFDWINAYRYLDKNMERVEDPRVQHIINTPIEEQLQTTLSYMKSIVEALKYLDNQDLLHNDLKPENILLNETGQPVLSDWDYACTFKVGSSPPIYAGTWKYIKPNTLIRDETTELFALAKTFCIDDPSIEEAIPSFMDVFEVLKTLSIKKKPELLPYIKSMILSLSALCRQMREGRTRMFGLGYPSLDQIITILDNKKKLLESLKTSLID